MHQYSAPIMRLILISTSLRKININQLNNISNDIIKLAILKEPQMKTDVGNNTKHLDRNKVTNTTDSAQFCEGMPRYTDTRSTMQSRRYIPRPNTRHDCTMRNTSN